MWFGFDKKAAHIVAELSCYKPLIESQSKLTNWFTRFSLCIINSLIKSTDRFSGFNESNTEEQGKLVIVVQNKVQTAAVKLLLSLFCFLFL